MSRQTASVSIPQEDRRGEEAGAAARWLELRDGVPRVWTRYTDLVAARASGSWIETIDGERYLDYTSGIGVTNTGHAHPRVVAAIASQAARGIHLQQNIIFHQPGLELHERLPGRFPNAAPDERYGLFLSNSGAEAVEAAVKLAKFATGRPAIVAFRGGFHGRTHAAMALTSSSLKTRGHYEPLLGSVYFAPFPYVLRNPTGRSEEAALAHSLAAIDELFATLVAPKDVAAFVVEPILGEGGYIPAPDGFLPALRAVANRHGILLAVDEIQTGFARTGRIFATEWTDATPDIVIMAKGIASGLPLSGILARRALLDAWTPGAHGGTYGGNAVACAAALATLDVIDDEDLAGNARRQGARLLDGLSRAAAGRARVAEVRGRGLMIGLELAEGHDLAPRADLAKALLAEAMARNVLLLSCGTHAQVVRVIPPLTTTEDEVELAIQAITESLDAIGA
jgi:4-aminobutyrate aminotransferase